MQRHGAGEQDERVEDGGRNQDVTDTACVYVTGCHLVRMANKDTH